MMVDQIDRENMSGSGQKFRRRRPFVFTLQVVESSRHEKRNTATLKVQKEGEGFSLYSTVVSRRRPVASGESHVSNAGVTIRKGLRNTNEPHLK
jgi:hypothetical protein